MRKYLLKLHLWLALASSPVLLLIGVTGCLLVFELSMDKWLDPGVFYVQQRGEPVSFETLVKRVHTAFPGKSITQVNLFGPGNAIEIRVDGQVRAYLDPYSGDVVGTRSGEPPSYWVRHLHRELVGGNAGIQIVRVATVIVLFQSVSGLWLWWPLKRIKVNLGASWRRINFDLHHAAGFFSSLLLCVIAVTGLMKSYGDRLQPFFDRITGEPAAVRKMASHRPAEPAPAAKIGFDQALATARATLPGAAPARITPAKTDTDPVVITMKFPGDSTAPGRSWVVMDQYSGEVLARQDARVAPAAAKIPIVNRAIHVGGFAGSPSRVLAFLVSLTLLLQVVSGFLIWWQKRAARSVKPRAREPIPIGAPSSSSV
jgi:uncharacterized iron-regulated membrane protein